MAKKPELVATNFSVKQTFEEALEQTYMEIYSALKTEPDVAKVAFIFYSPENNSLNSATVAKDRIGGLEELEETINELTKKLKN
jgi:hypothetical protein